jgi:tetratricopeptide (TPR) repeat protein
MIIANFYHIAGMHHFSHGEQSSTAMQFLEKALLLSRSCGDTDNQSSILIDIAEICQRMGDAGIAQIHANEARRLAKLSANPYNEANALRFAAQCTTQLGDYQNSIVQLHRAKELLCVCGMSGGVLDNRITMDRAEVHLMKSEYTDAKSIHTQIQQHPDQEPIVNAWALVNIAQIDVMIGATEESVQQNLNKAKAIFSATKAVNGITWCEMLLADLRLREGDTLSTKTFFLQSLNSSRGRHNEFVSFTLERLADKTRWGVRECASPWPVVYLAYAQQSKEKLALNKTLLFLGDVFISQGDVDTAHSLFTVALEGFVYMDVHRSRAQCLLRLGDLANKKGKLPDAAEHWIAARSLFEVSSQAKDAAQIDERLALLEHNRKALAHLATLHPPEIISSELSAEVNRYVIEEQDGQVGKNLPEGIIFSAM